MTQRLLSALLLFSALLLASTPAHADKDAVQFGSNIVVPEGQSVHDAVCFFCSVNAKGDIDHDVVVFFGNVHIAHRQDTMSWCSLEPCARKTTPLSVTM